MLSEDARRGESQIDTILSLMLGDVQSVLPTRDGSVQINALSQRIAASHSTKQSHGCKCTTPKHLLPRSKASGIGHVYPPRVELIACEHKRDVARSMFSSVVWLSAMFATFTTITKP